LLPAFPLTHQLPRTLSNGLGSQGIDLIVAQGIKRFAGDWRGFCSSNHLVPIQTSLLLVKQGIAIYIIVV
jgi:hypothetical protein